MDQDDPTLPTESADESKLIGEGLDQTLSHCANSSDSFVVSEADIDDVEMTISQFMEAKGLKGGVELDGPGGSASNSLRDRQGRKYDLGELIARGGMGAVLDAKDHCIRRHVAMKVMLKKQQSPEGVMRFIEEAQVTGQLEHPSIVPVHELGVDASGTVFYTMKYVQGRTLKDVLHAIREGDLETIEAFPLVRLLNIFLKVCDALAFAHARHVIHRDLKPENIMLGEYGEVLVVDWGLAKVINDTDSSQASNLPKPVDSMVTSDRLDDNTNSALTMDGQVLGTPAFMPPEQASGRLSEIDERCDVYSLGAVLYNILTLHKPVHGKSIVEILKNVSDGNITHPIRFGRSRKSTADHSDVNLAVQLHHCQSGRVPESLAAVAMKALATKRDARYDSVLRLQQEVQSYLDGFATLAENASLFRQCVLLFNRNKKEAALLTGAFLALVAITGGFMFSLNQKKTQAQTAERVAEVARGEAETSRNDAVASAMKATAAEAVAKQEADNALRSLKIAERNAYYSDMLLAKTKWDNAGIGEFKELLNRYADRDDLRGFEWDYWNRIGDQASLKLQGRSGAVTDVEYSPDGTQLVTSAIDGTIKLWDASTGQQLHTFSGHSARVESVAFSPDGSRFASASRDKTVMVWDVVSQQEILTFRGHSQAVGSVSFSPDGSQLVTTSLFGNPRGELKVWDAVTGQESLDLKGRIVDMRDSTFSPDGTQLAFVVRDNAVKICDATTGRVTLTLEGHTHRVLCLAFSPDGTRLASAGHDKTVKVWDTGTGEEVFTLEAHSHVISSVSFNADGTRLASANADKTVKIWDAETGRQVMTLKGHLQPVNSVSFSPDGTRLASASNDGTTIVWDLTPEQESLELGHASGSVLTSLAFSPDGAILASSKVNDSVTLWDVASGQAFGTLKVRLGQARCISFSPDGTRLAVASGDFYSTRNPLPGAVQVWDVVSGQEILTIKADQRTVLGVTFSPDGNRLATGSESGAINLWVGDTGELVQALSALPKRVNAVQFSTDSRLLATASGAGSVKLWDVASGKESMTLMTRGGPVNDVSFSPDGKRLASAHTHGGIRVWDLAKAEVALTVSPSLGEIRSVSFSPDGRRLVAVGHEHAVKMWDSASGQQTLALLGHEDQIKCVSFSPDGTRIATADFYGRLLLWDSRPWTPELRTQRAARGYLKIMRERMQSLEALQSYIRDDKTIREEVRQQTLQWAELFWNNRESN